MISHLHDCMDSWVLFDTFIFFALLGIVIGLFYKYEKIHQKIF